jgi:hypothetical protein
MENINGQNDISTKIRKKEERQSYYIEPRESEKTWVEQENDKK